MAHSMRAGAVLRQPDSSDLREPTRSGAPDPSITEQVNEKLTFIRRAMEKTGWTQEAMAQEMGYRDETYVNKVLSGDKPLSARFEAALPDDVEALVAKWNAERFGHIVVEPVTGPDAVRQLVSGLVGVLGGGALPARAERMAKIVETPEPARKRA